MYDLPFQASSRINVETKPLCSSLSLQTHPQKVRLAEKYLTRFLNTTADPAVRANPVST